MTDLLADTIGELVLIYRGCYLWGKTLLGSSRVQSESANLLLFFLQLPSHAFLCQRMIDFGKRLIA